jgi:ABC-type lipoprotein release transport system permease subunit
VTEHGSTSSSGILPPGGLLLRLAWRNLWRNNKRTLIAAGSVFFAVLLAVLMSAVQEGSHEYMINSAVGFSTGHLQIQGRGYWEKRSLDQSMAFDTSLVGVVRALPHVLHAVPRLEAYALLSHGTVTRVVPVLGIDPAAESAMTGLGKRVTRGAEVNAWSDGVVLAEGLARLLRADVGDSIVLYGQGYRGVTAAAILPVEAIVHFAIPDLDNALCYLPLETAQRIFAAEGRVTSLAILLDVDGAVDVTAAAVRSRLPADVDVLTWRDMLPELLQAIAVDDGGTVLMLLILYVVVGFGIFGTVIMMTAERSREFGVLIALGMRRGKLMIITVIESLVMSLLGALGGIAVSIPLVIYFHSAPIRLGGEYAKAMAAYGMEPILPVSVDPMVFVTQGIIVVLLAMASALYPVTVLRRLQPVRAMRG